MSIWRCLCLYGDVCVYMEMFVSIWRCLCLYGDVCVYMEMFVSIWRCSYNMIIYVVV